MNREHETQRKSLTQLWRYIFMLHDKDLSTLLFWRIYDGICQISLVCPSKFALSYAKIHIPIIASVSEHQPTTWVSFFFDLHILVCTFPAGLWFCIKNINDERVFGKSVWTDLNWGWHVCHILPSDG